MPFPPVFPASHAQERLWFLEQMHPDRPVYNIPLALKIEGPMNVGVLELAINDVVSRHEALRTRFESNHGHPVQIIAAATHVPLPLIDLRLLPASEREVHASRLAREDAARPFDLQRLPLLRAQLLVLDETTRILVMVVHHIVFDGWSLSILLREISACYAARLGGQQAGLPELPVHYSDYSMWQRDWLPTREASVQWWREKFAAPPPPLELPADHPRPPVPAGRGRIESRPLPASVRAPFQDLVRREGLTSFMVLLGAFQALLHRYTGHSDIVVGSPVAGRDRPEMEGLIGLFINTLALRTDLSGDPSFRQLLRRVRTTVIDALTHGDVPFGKIIETLQPERSVSHQPLCQVLFAYETAAVDALHWPGLRLTQLQLDSGTSKYDLSLYIVETAGGLVARAEYDTDLFESTTIQRFLRHYEALLEAALAQPDRALSQLDLLAPDERRQLLVEWNATSADYPRDGTVHELIRAQSARTPQAVAVIAEGRPLNYRELDEQSNQLAHHLQSVGVHPGVLVGLCVERGPGMLVGLLGILKAGGAYVPLDPAFPQQRLALMLSDAQVAVTVTESSLQSVLPAEDRGTEVLLDREWPLIAKHPVTPPASAAGPDDPAYVIYTSGSTGRPKGVEIPHRAAVNFLCSMQHTPGLSASDIMLAVTTLSFDIAVLELFLPLITGARIQVASREEAADAERLAALITSSGATVMQATPATWRMLLAAHWPGRPDLRLLCGGEALPRELADQLLPRCRELWNLYGPTETTVWSAVTRVLDDDQPIVIGRPVANTQLHLLDAQLNLVPVGVPAELFIGGDGLALGYLRQPRLTAEKFIPDPFRREPGARLYRTGDVGRRLPNGEIELLGRADHQVKIRGYRIELGDIESALRLAPHVREAVVVAREDKPGDKQLAAYVITDGSPESPALWREYLRSKLPDYMVPSAFVALAEFPLTPNGKVDRRSLPVPGPGRGEAGAPPREGLEKKIAAIWSEVLSVSEPGATDSFFDLGGHSLRVAEVQVLLRERLSLTVPILTLFQHPTIQSLARHLEGRPAGNSLRQQAAERAQRQRASRRPARTVILPSAS